MGNVCASAREKYEENKGPANELITKMQSNMKIKMALAKEQIEQAQVKAREKYDETRLKMKGS